MEASAVRFEIYSLHGRLLGEADTMTRGEQLLAAWHSAKYLIGVDANGNRTCLRERSELH